MSADTNPNQEELNKSSAPAKEEEIQSHPPGGISQVKDIFSIFKPVEGFYITPVLLILNILVFILMAVTGVNVFEPDSASLLKWGANFRPVTLDDEWWRLITNFFLHIGILHLLMNMYALLYIGILLEPILGSIRFISAYLLAGIAASLASLWWHDMTISAGASGAIFGMYGVFLALLSTNLIEKSARTALFSSIAIFVGFNLLNGLKGGIDNAAHIGGLVSGLVIGYAFIPGLKKPENKKLTQGTIGLLAVLILAASLILYQKIPNDIGAYNKKMEIFTQTESKALSIYDLPDDMATDKVLERIKEGEGNWQENIKLLDGLQGLKLPANIISRNQLLREYCELRIGSYQLLYKAVAENTELYQEEIEKFNQQIEKKINELGVGMN